MRNHAASDAVKAPGEEQFPNVPPSARRDPLVTEFAKAQSDLDRIEAQRIAAKARIAALRKELAALDATPRPVVPESLSGFVPRTPADKVKLFLQLFRGRADLYPTRFVSKKTGKAGYAPACSNKFVPGVCELPKVKCGDCTRQAFKPVDDAAVIAHLKGQHVMGVYPMQDDETCWFLAVDFDKSAWTDDVRAFVRDKPSTWGCLWRSSAHARATERTSGFSFRRPSRRPQLARWAATSSPRPWRSRHELSMDSYDRLFPSQDTMPRGGFGNLIALPLQHGPRQEGNSVFLDDDLAAVPDEQQWAYLASITRIDALTVERIASEATPRREASSAFAWRKWRTKRTLRRGRGCHPGRREQLRITGPLPNRVSAVLAQRLFVAKAGLPSPLLNQIKRLRRSRIRSSTRSRACDCRRR